VSFLQGSVRIECISVMVRSRNFSGAAVSFFNGKRGLAGLRDGMFMARQPSRAALVGKPDCQGASRETNPLPAAGTRSRFTPAGSSALFYAARIADQGAPRACYRRIRRTRCIEGTVADCAHSLRHGRCPSITTLDRPLNVFTGSAYQRDFACSRSSRQTVAGDTPRRIDRSLLFNSSSSSRGR